MEYTRRNAIRSEIFREVGILSLLIELEEKRLQLFAHVKRMDRAIIPRRALELKFKGRRHMRRSRIGWFCLVLEEIKKKGNELARNRRGGTVGR
jgi:hypothetical protein